MSQSQIQDDDQYPELLSDIAQQVKVRLSTLVNEKQALDVERAKQIGWEVAEHVRAHFAGELIYIPKGRQFEASQLHQAIWDKFNGHNIPELVGEFKMAEQSIYRVIKFMRARNVRRNQLSLIED
ncbi:Mor transcription activator family protein [Polaromonas sp. JS666]|uniref:Mor transcription activator family protein n=1 Tax=Polaromonas sp. (strain JS666 / ATCC BAA-500) TaxID=296591 RepID=UPI0000464B41|nr:Mor transcription activator family protein [Polaromonas sp. JS666]ABE45671.1 prophage MuMc02, transcriptional regulator, putative [Polaromonas sp. JS666]